MRMVIGFIVHFILPDFTHSFDHGVRIGELTRGQFGIYFPAIDADFKRATAGRHERERPNALFEL